MLFAVTLLLCALPFLIVVTALADKPSAAAIGRHMGLDRRAAAVFGHLLASRRPLMRPSPAPRRWRPGSGGRLRRGATPAATDITALAWFLLSSCFTPESLRIAPMKVFAGCRLPRSRVASDSGISPHLGG
jgi:hypothetical protein